METTKTQPPLLPAQMTSAFVTYWSPMKRKNFISSGNVWFDYELEAYRIDGLFNPWDVDQTGYQLWMSEICLYGQGKNYRYTLPYNVKYLANTNGDFNYKTSQIEAIVVDENLPILPRDILVLGKAIYKGSMEVIGFNVDCWQFEQNNTYNMHCFYLKKGGSELVRMEQFKNEQLLIRDFPNLSIQKIDKNIFCKY